MLRNVTHGLLATLAALTALAAPASAGITPIDDFLAPVVGERSAPVFATGPGGTRFAAWVEGDPARIVVGDRADGARTYARRTDVDPAGPAPTSTELTVLGAPLLAADAAGNLTLVWTRGGGAAPPGILVATRPAGAASFGPATILAQGSVYALTLGGSDDGSALITWYSAGATWAVWRRGTGAFSAPATLFAGDAEDVQVGRNGTMAAVGAVNNFADDALFVSSKSPVVRRRLPGDEAFGAPEHLENARRDLDNPEAFALQIASDGTTWLSEPTGSDDRSLYRATPGAEFAPRCSSRWEAWRFDSEDRVSFANVYVGAREQVILDLGRLASRNDPCAQYATIATVALPTGSDLAELLVTGDPLGGTHALWSEARTPYGPRQIQVGYVPPLTRLDAGQAAKIQTQLLSETGRFVQDLAVDPRGNALASWETEAGGRAGVFDHSAPTITSLAVPADAYLGEATTIAATATDDYSEPLSFRWTLKPGGEREAKVFTGSSVSIVPWTRTSQRVDYTLEVTDGAGNLATAKGSFSTTKRQRPLSVGIALGGRQLRPMASGKPIEPGSVSKRSGGTAITLTSSIAGPVRFTLERSERGRLDGATCRRLRRTGKRCSRLTALKATTTVKVPEGASTLRLTGQWGGKALRPGLYRLTGILSEGKRTSAPTTVSVRVVR